MKYALIPADVKKPVEFKDDEPSLDLWQSVVGGYIEGVTVQESPTSPALRMYCNEEGRVIGLPPNGRATALRVVATRGMFRSDGLLIAGDVAVIGGYDMAGDDVELNDEQIAYLQRLAEIPVP